ncbi:unnamed protein product [Bathycoccus prasinos]|jgi:flap endonuclease-1|uniref:Flap endonuclease 1 n=1 Tax=Bathycoccus prasinos TaxID=41875 RepID=K8E976_9CHLO|nr:predicted protein [Bathycoccus prasinos]CCO14191.1 predicted protein [Bathycoccus prasinos]|mmetsp:Transcript_1162/g.3581  ORF Transcript_1162/g.3581 Transcript_1162/m.3581 type:complete len:391 (+) Transcript_1162:32-1204(+)|eukprot:XP_007515312.1 predicted protein [Bathycoccus prasinos]
MGIKGLSKLLAEHSPGCSMERKFQSYLDRKIAIDASMHIYQYLMVVGRSGESQLTDENGQVTAHLIGVLSRTCRMLEAGIKPVYVFDGKPPTLKGGELAKRKDKRDQAEKDLEVARETGDKDAIEKAAKRTVRVSKEQNQEVMRLVKLLGVPVFEAPCEAEATCAAMCKAGLVHGAATEDMDTLTFACPRLIRNLMAPASQKKDIAEYDFDKVLKGLDLDYDQFIDLCILCGCDYTDSIRGIGPVTALQLIREYKNIETILENIKDKKYVVPENFMYKEARQLFKEPEVIDTNNLELKWSKPNEEGVIEFLVKEKSFNEERVRNALARIKKAKAGVASQNRLESFFGAATVKSSTIGKRKELEKKKGSKGVVGGFKKSKGVGGFSKSKKN